MVSESKRTARERRSWLRDEFTGKNSIISRLYKHSFIELRGRRGEMRPCRMRKMNFVLPCTNLTQMHLIQTSTSTQCAAWSLILHAQ